MPPKSTWHKLWDNKWISDDGRFVATRAKRGGSISPGNPGKSKRPQGPNNLEALVGSLRNHKNDLWTVEDKLRPKEPLKSNLLKDIKEMVEERLREEKEAKRRELGLKSMRALEWNPAEDSRRERGSGS